MYILLISNPQKPSKTPKASQKANNPSSHQTYTEFLKIQELQISNLQAGACLVDGGYTFVLVASNLGFPICAARDHSCEWWRAPGPGLVGFAATAHGGRDGFGVMQVRSVHFFVEGEPVV